MTKAQHKSKSHIIFKNAAYALVNDTQGLHWEKNRTVTVEPGKPWKIQGPTRSTTQDTGTIDASSCVLLPGLTNGHTHVAMGFFRSFEYGFRANIIGDLMFRLEKHLTPDMVRAFARMGIAECLLTGSSRIIDHYYYADEVAQACVELGIRGLICDCALDLQGPKTSDEDFERHDAFLHRWRGKNSLVTPLVGPHAPDSLSEDRGKKLADYARTHGMMIHFHLAQTKREVDSINQKYKCSPIRYAYERGWLSERSIAAHCVYANQDDVRILAQSQTHVAFCPSSQSVFAKVAAFEDFSKAGVKLLLGTDAYGASDSMSLLREINVAQTHQKMRLPPEKFDPLLPLRWATQSLCPLGDDVLALDLKPLENFIFNHQDPSMILPFALDQLPVRHSVIAGKWVVRNGRLTHGKLENLREEADHYYKWLFKKESRALHHEASL